MSGQGGDRVDRERERENFKQAEICADSMSDTWLELKTMRS